MQDKNRLISEQNQNLLKNMDYIKKYDIDFTIFPEEILEPLKVNGSKFHECTFPKMVWYRLFFDKIYTNLSKIIYLDVDLVVNRDLSILFSKNLGNKLFTGVLDVEHYRVSTLQQQSQHCINNIKLSYINGGVLLLNLDKIRNYDMVNKLSQGFNNTGCTFKMCEQDSINYIFQNDINLISKKWNASFMQAPKFINHFILHDKPNFYPKPWNVKNALETWHNDPDKLPMDHKFYWFYRDITPWSTRIDNLNNLLNKNRSKVIILIYNT